MIRSDSESTRAEAARIVSTGGLIVFRTDTFYGLGADPLNRAALQRLRELKGREENKPILILISDMDKLDRFVGEKSGIFGRIATGHWPAPLTLIGPARHELLTELTAGTSTLGARGCRFARRISGDTENSRMSEARFLECGGLTPLFGYP